MQRRSFTEPHLPTPSPTFSSPPYLFPIIHLYQRPRPKLMYGTQTRQALFLLALPIRQLFPISLWIIPPLWCLVDIEPAVNLSSSNPSVLSSPTSAQKGFAQTYSRTISTMINNQDLNSTWPSLLHWPCFPLNSISTRCAKSADSSLDIGNLYSG